MKISRRLRLSRSALIWLIMLITLAIISDYSATAMSLGCISVKCPNCGNYLDPQCASNGITYPNLCWIECYNRKEECDQKIHVVHNGWCAMTIRPRRKISTRATTLSSSSLISYWTERPVCNITLCICQPAYNPICGSDGVTYSNTCYFRCARRCFKDLEFVKCGLCAWTFPPSRLCLGRTTHEIINTNSISE